MSNQSGGSDILTNVTPNHADALARTLKALGDPIRLRIVSTIAATREPDVCVCDITAMFTVSQPTISHHLKVLREAGIVDCERRGTWVHYSLTPSVTPLIEAILSTTPPEANTSNCC
ncbi:helix-turn-helix transcriptional regulator [Hoyosella rhizosphaerae]|uniref:Transcriptional regulator n=1 Tax=Hoyosella rhizosphaerae TaxID=1755582 RepID=A0A916UGN6_9ACTN|nr:metalloregulator ArsR/SmtB family transcription factor [Hoyosella rhizosphaerae]MBN4928085.1 helix-turn-helix transcriptional regulator [Hoyosella rhizosphaerae]GGC72296.1 transcriptional regulator [Hoyosella rhizosphaerae]